jgi:hypothetical protein
MHLPFLARLALSFLTGALWVPLSTLASERFGSQIGGLLASPDVWNTRLKDYNHQGCVALEIESLSPPRLKRDADGKLALRATVSASDSNELGSAACAYDPASSSGILFTRRVKSATKLTVGLWMTGLRP